MRYINDIWQRQPQNFGQNLNKIYCNFHVGHEKRCFCFRFMCHKMPLSLLMCVCVCVWQNSYKYLKACVWEEGSSASFMHFHNAFWFKYFSLRKGKTMKFSGVNWGSKITKYITYLLYFIVEHKLSNFSYCKKYCLLIDLCNFLCLCSEGEDGIWDQVARIYTRTNATSYQVTGLTPFTVYSFRLLAVNKLGISPPSKESYYIVTLREGK